MVQVLPQWLRGLLGVSKLISTAVRWTAAFLPFLIPLHMFKLHRRSLVSPMMAPLCLMRHLFPDHKAMPVKEMHF